MGNLGFGASRYPRDIRRVEIELRPSTRPDRWVSVRTAVYGTGITEEIKNKTVSTGAANEDDCVTSFAGSAATAAAPAARFRRGPSVRARPDTDRNRGRGRGRRRRRRHHRVRAKAAVAGDDPLRNEFETRRKPFTRLLIFPFPGDLRKPGEMTADCRDRTDSDERTHAPTPGYHTRLLSLRRCLHRNARRIRSSNSCATEWRARRERLRHTEAAAAAAA